MLFVRGRSCCDGSRRIKRFKIDAPLNLCVVIPVSANANFYTLFRNHFPGYCRANQVESSSTKNNKQASNPDRCFRVLPPFSFPFGFAARFGIAPGKSEKPLPSGGKATTLLSFMPEPVSLQGAFSLSLSRQGFRDSLSHFLQVHRFHTLRLETPQIASPTSPAPQAPRCYFLRSEGDGQRAADLGDPIGVGKLGRGDISGQLFDGC